MADPVIIAENIRKEFVRPNERQTSLKQAIIHPFRSRAKSTITALQDIDFKIEEGEFFGVVGRNGSGKSTLLKILAGIYQPTNGMVAVKGKLVPFIELGVGFNPELTGRENIYLNAALLGFSSEETEAMYDDIVEFAELEDFMGQKLKNYSSGMQVRLAFSIAIQAKADILLLDEVLAVGDAAFQRKCFNYFQILKKQKKTVILVTHDMAAIREYCTRAMLIDDTKIVAEGKPDKIAQSYNRLFAEDVIETPSDDEDDDELPKRYGNNDLKFSSVKVAKKAMNDDDKFLEVEVNLKASKDVDSPNIGISIKDASDAFVCGTNTRILGKSFGKVKKGETIKLSWKVPNVFHDGKHFVNVAAVDLTEAVQYDWWDEAAHFSVAREHKTPFIVSPKIQLKERK